MDAKYNWLIDNGRDSPHSQYGGVCALDCHGRGFDGTGGKDLAATTPT